MINVPSLRLFAAPGRRIAQLTSAGFDIVMLEMFGTLCYGATLVMKDPGDPFEHLKRVHATNLTPSVLGALLPEDYSHLDMIALAGEPVPQPMADTWGVGRDLRNVYGPSEVSVSESLLLPLLVFPSHSFGRTFIHKVNRSVDPYQPQSVFFPAKRSPSGPVYPVSAPTYSTTACAPSHRVSRGRFTSRETK